MNIVHGSGRRSNRRRSSAPRGKKNNNKGCGTTDRAAFNSNLIDIFQSEYNRVPHTTTTAIPIENDPLRDTHEKQVIQWKFDQLDDNGDTYLKKKELRDLRRMAKKIVKPKICAKSFAKFCDLDQDRKISRSEWSVCVGVDINIKISGIRFTGVGSMAYEPKVVGLIPSGVDRFSRGENHRYARHMILWRVKDPISINLALVLVAKLNHGNI
ncbi:SPARC-related modular calcium-binding protein 1 [Trichonephila clavipes]|nr:SPARC-related modular calcium-binding protein 1 [Trichonephila clavipes]